METVREAREYIFNNADTEAADRHRYLAEILDPFTRARLSTIGNLAGRRCLELGAGGGSIAGWLAEQVGPTGQVLATDLDTRYLPTDGGYEVRQHNLITEPVPDGPWDLIHARLVLLHLAPRREILTRLVAALAPGGALMLEEWDGTVGNYVLATPDEEATALLDSFQQTTNVILRNKGMSQVWSRQMHAAMLAEGLDPVDTELHARSWAGGTAGMLLLTVTLAQVRDAYLAAGFTEQQLTRIEELARDPRVVWRGLMTYSTIGRRPANP